MRGDSMFMLKTVYWKYSKCRFPSTGKFPLSEFPLTLYLTRLKLIISQRNRPDYMICEYLGPNVAYDKPILVNHDGLYYLNLKPEFAVDGLWWHNGCKNQWGYNPTKHKLRQK